MDILVLSNVLCGNIETTIYESWMRYHTSGVNYINKYYMKHLKTLTQFCIYNI